MQTLKTFLVVSLAMCHMFNANPLTLVSNPAKPGSPFLQYTFLFDYHDILGSGEMVQDSKYGPSLPYEPKGGLTVGVKLSVFDLKYSDCELDMVVNFEKSVSVELKGNPEEKEGFLDSLIGDEYVVVNFRNHREDSKFWPDFDLVKKSEIEEGFFSRCGPRTKTRQSLPKRKKNALLF